MSEPRLILRMFAWISFNNPSFHLNESFQGGPFFKSDAFVTKAYPVSIGKLNVAKSSFLNKLMIFAEGNLTKNSIEAFIRAFEINFIIHAEVSWEGWNEDKKVVVFQFQWGIQDGTDVVNADSFEAILR